MTTLESILFACLWVGAIAYTLFAPIYAWWARRVWWRLGTGWGILVASTSVALLLDLTLLFRVIEVTPFVGLLVTTIVVALIALSGVLKLAALSREIRRSRKP